MIDVFKVLGKDPDVLQALRLAFKAGRMRGRDEMHGGVRKYDHEVTQPDFKEWYEQATQERQEGK